VGWAGDSLDFDRLGISRYQRVRMGFGERTRLILPIGGLLLEFASSHGPSDALRLCTASV